MKEGVHFVYDNIRSIDMGLVNCQVSGGMFEEAFLAGREISEKQISGKDKPYFQEVRLSSLSFELTFAFEYVYDEEKIRKVARWLSPDYYKPFYTIDNPSRVFYCMPSGDSNLVHNGMKEGYITLTMKCDSPYSYTPVYINNNNVFLSTDLTTNVLDNTFNSGDGIFNNVEIINDNRIQLSSTSVATWSMFSGMSWSDL